MLGDEHSGGRLPFVDEPTFMGHTQAISRFEGRGFVGGHGFLSHGHRLYRSMCQIRKQ